MTTLTVPELAHLLLALGLLLAAAHGFGFVMTRLNQPRVIGEILGGLVLGPTVFGTIAPRLQAIAFPSSTAVPTILDAVYGLGLLLLMFTAGAEIRGFFHRSERKVVTWISLVGVAFPFAAGLVAVWILHFPSLRGSASTDAAFVIVFGIAIAITSIPVVSRIMLDLGILETSFARIVLGVAVVEDVLLYLLLAIALGLVANSPGDSWGLPLSLGLEPGSAGNVLYHVVAELTFLAGCLALGPWMYSRLPRRYNPVERGNPIGFQLVFLFGLSFFAIYLGVVPLFGAFIAGIVVSTLPGERAARASESLKAFSFAFFVPVYFAIVGLRLDLLEFSIWFFVPFFVFACVVKAVSVYAGARLAGEGKVSSKNLAVTLNARGGPGIVLASVALDANIISGAFYSSLVMLAVLTSLLAGSWLGRIVRSGVALRDERTPT